MQRIRILAPIIAIALTVAAGMGDKATGGSGTLYTVDTTSDASLTVCNGGVDNDCSLRGALTMANAPSSPGDTILFDATDFPAGAPATIQIASGLVFGGGDDVLDAAGRGVIIDAVNVEPSPTNYRCLRVSSNQNVVRSLQVTDCLIGIEVEGNDNGIHSNVVYDNLNGISLLGNANELNLNKVGTNATGTAVNPAGGNNTGIVVVGDSNEFGTETANTISGNIDGVDIQSSANLTALRRNYIGTDATGIVDVGNLNAGIVVNGTNTAIGQPFGAGTNNVISGNEGPGVLMFGTATGTSILGNYIGLAGNGTGLANDGDGIDIEGGSGNCIGGSFSGPTCTVGPLTRNFISGNGGAGINIEDGATGNQIYGNWIGLDGTDGLPLGNDDGGILIGEGNDTLIGEQLPGYGNLIGHNGGAGISVISGTENQFEDNEIFSNTGLGIDLGDDGVTPNDADDTDTGANELQNYPVLTSATSVTSGTTITGTFNSLPSTDFYFQFYSSISCDPSGFGEGETLIASGLGGGVTDANGDLAINVTIPTSVPGLRYITALAATDTIPASTSEFSNCVQVPPIVVNSAADPGDGTCTLANCTLREAITASNADPGFSVVHFGIGSGPQTISPTTPLPGITSQIWINGRTQPGYAGSPIIELNGAGIVADSQGLSMSAHGNIIEGLVINRFNEFGLVLGSQVNVIRNNYIGTNVAGTADLGNRLGGFSIGSPNNVIGGNTPADRNVISGNDDHGIVIQGATSSTRITGNYIGTNAMGTAALGNTGAGVRVLGGPTNSTIGGSTAGERNVISGNSLQGVEINGAGTSGNVVAGNYIGTNAAGTADISTTQNGVEISGGATSNMVGGGAAGAGNVISGNAYGVRITGTTSDNNSIQGNLLGTDAAGTAALGNQYGVSIGDASGTLVGGLIAGVRNVISGNTIFGVEIKQISATGNFIRGNYIGTDITGMFALGNAGIGVLVDGGDGNTIGGSTAADTNVIAATGPNQFGNPGHGILLNSDDNFVYSNLIGVGADGVKPLGNAADGIQIAGTAGNDIGLSAATANTIAFNGGVGVRILSLSMGNNPGNTVRQNSIYANGGMGMDLGAAGINSNDNNDPDQGANGLQNYPNISAVTIIQPPGPPAPGTYISGSINSIPNSVFSVDIYHTYGCDASGHGEGAVFLGTVSGVATGVTGNAVWNFFTPQIPLVGSFISTIAMDAGGSTSEFSLCRAGPNDADDDNDGYTDVDESERPLCNGATNDDGPPAVNDDMLVNDGCLSWIVAEVACADAIDNDGDGFVNDGCPTSGAFSEAQFKIGTSASDPCGIDGWPSELFSAGLSANKLDIQDIVSFLSPVRRIDRSPPHPSFSSRWDVTPGPAGLGTFINILDLTTLINATTGNPPMFNGVRAFNKTCPFPP